MEHSMFTIPTDKSIQMQVLEQSNQPTLWMPVPLPPCLI